MQLRPYQEKAIEDLMAEVEMFGEKNIVLEAPTGSGKSVIISELCKRLDGNIVVMVNITALIDQIANHLRECNIDFSILKAGMDEHYSENHRVQLVMSQTFYSRAEDINMHCDYLIIDERHREYDTDRTKLLLNKLAPKSVIGLTATPYDQAGCKLTDSFPLQSISVRDLTDQGFLSPVKYFVPKFATDLGLEDLRMSGSDYSGSAIDEKFNTDWFMDGMVTSMNIMNAKNKKTLVFCSSIDQCEMATKFLQDAGYLAQSIHSKKSKKENELILSSFKASKPEGLLADIEVKCLVSVSKLNIGFDVKDIELGVMLRPTKVRSLYIQTVGRLTRIAEGKNHAEFLDLAGTVMEHGFHDEVYHPADYGDKKAIEESKEILSARHIKHIVGDFPTEVNREMVVNFVKELEKKQKRIDQMSMKDLSALYEESDNIYVILKVAYQIQKLKTGQNFTDSTIDWIGNNWMEWFQREPHNKQKWLKALKTRAKNIVRDNKKLASLYYFIEFLQENQDSYY